MTKGWGYGGSRRGGTTGGRDGRPDIGNGKRTSQAPREGGSAGAAPAAVEQRKSAGGKQEQEYVCSRSRSRRGTAAEERQVTTTQAIREGGSHSGKHEQRRPQQKSKSLDCRRGGGGGGGGYRSPRSVSEAAANMMIEAVAATATADEDEGSEYSSGSYETDSASQQAVGDGGGTEKPAEQKKGAQPKKDDIVHFDYAKGMLLHARYRVVRLLGDGTFGRVLLVEDQKKERQVAIKVIRNVEKYIRNAKREAEILKDIREADPKKAAGCVRMHDTFWHKTPDPGGERFFCLAFEVLGMSLYDLLKLNRFRGLWVQDIQAIAQQCLEALAFLHHELNLTHTDLKLENILFACVEQPCPAEFPREAAFQQSHRSQHSKSHHQYVRPASTQVKLIDFGNATYELEHHSSIINTRQYRAPEVILAIGWNERSDLWSVGCILMELYTGELLFRTHESLEHLALMERAIETFPSGMLGAASQARREQFLVQERLAAALIGDGSGGGEGPATGCGAGAGDAWRLHWPEKASSAQSLRQVRQQRPLEKMVQEGHRALADFVASLLILDPARRPTASEALAHPFLFDTFSN